jgi:hypothetical protein
MDLPSEADIRHLIASYAELKASHGPAFSDSELVLPTADFFPDEFRLDGESVASFMKRMLSYAPVAADLPVGLRFIQPDEASGAGSCSSGACGTGGKGAPLREGVTELDDGYLVDVNVGDVGSPTLLATTLARSAGAIVLSEAGEAPSDIGTMSEVAAVACGYGVLLANGSYVYAKGCGGVRVHQATRLPVEQIALLLAVFVRDHDLKSNVARAQLEVTPAEAFDQAIALIDSNPEIVAALRSRPEMLAAGLFSIEPVKGVLGRFFARRRADAPLDDAFSALGKG